jgi:hypothetical protein
VGALLHPISVRKQSIQQVSAPEEACDHVHIFLMNGADPLNLGNMPGLRHYIQTLGFKHATYGQLYDIARFHREICRIHHEDPEARIVVVGFSLGANVTKSLADLLRREAIGIDLLVYLSSNHTVPFSHRRPENVDRFVDILTGTWALTEATDDNSQRHNLAGRGHLAAPSDPQALKILALELDRVAGRVRPADPIAFAVPASHIQSIRGCAP